MLSADSPASWSVKIRDKESRYSALSWLALVVGRQNEGSQGDTLKHRAITIIARSREQIRRGTH
jgi:hypothetical protein